MRVRVVISKAAPASTPMSFSSRTIDRVVNRAVTEIGRHIAANKISDALLRREVLTELLGYDDRPKILTRRQWNVEAKGKLVALSDFPNFSKSEYDVE